MVSVIGSASLKAGGEEQDVPAGPPFSYGLASGRPVGSPASVIVTNGVRDPGSNGKPGDRPASVWAVQRRHDLSRNRRDLLRAAVFFALEQRDGLLVRSDLRSHVRRERYGLNVSDASAR
jgi:hypothetical protein